MSVLGWGTGFGAKLFDLLVLAAAWGAAPPRSLSLMPYGKLYPINPGDFFQPLSALLLVGSVGALIAGWRAPRSLRLWLMVSVVMLAIIWVLTPIVFWPLINDLWAVANARLALSDLQTRALSHQWVVWDSFRTMLIAVGFVSSVRAISAYAHAPKPVS